MLKRLKTWVVNKKETIKLSIENLSSNQLCDWDNVFETALTPLFWFVDNYASKLGTSFVIFCCLIMGTVVAVSYWIGLPFWWQKSPTTTIFLLLFGNWLMVNCFFHYYMGILCGPGFPPEDTFYEYVAGICKKCIQVKPHRTHHCSVCNTCILLMDHHCPWLNNCVGHYNRRYFYLFMAYIEISVIFLIIFGVEIAYNEVWLSYISEDQDLYGYPVQVNTSLPREEWIVKPTTAESDTIISEERYRSMRRRAIIFTSIVCLGVAIAIGTLLYGHTRIISKGETSIEKHINETQKKIYAAKNQIYINPYDFGLYKNWTLFLGIENDSGRTWFHVLFPSAHKPFGDGIVWPNIASTEQEWKDFFHHKHR